MKDLSIQELNAFGNNSLVQNLGIEFLEAREGYVKAKMPVDHRTMQPMGLLHGGASMAFAETIGGLGSLLLIDTDEYDALGTAFSANHTGGAKEGYVIGEAKIVHHGRLTHVWNIEVRDETGRLISTSRLTNTVLEKRK